ncbi:MAG TPA: EamA family transporter [Ktedonobacteraceae bacterium]
MDVTGIVLGVTVALLWGSTESISAFAARRIGALRTTVFSQLAGLVTVASISAFFPGAWESFTPLMILMGACSGLLASVGYYSLYRGLAAGPITLVSTISSGSSIITLLLALLLLHEILPLSSLIALGIILLGIIRASTNFKDLLNISSLKSRVWVQGNGGVKWALLTVLAFGAMDFSVGLSAKIAGWLLPVLFMRCFSLLFLSTIYLWTRYLTQVRQRSSAHLQKFQAKDAPGVFSREKRTALQGEDILGDTAVVLSSRKQRSPQKGTLSGVPSMAASKQGLHSLRKAPLIDITNKLLPPVNLLPTRSAIGVLARLTSTSPLQPANIIVLPSTITNLSRMARARGILLAIVEGMFECLAVLLFSLAAQITSTGITSVLANSYVVVSLIVGLIVFHERLILHQIIGIGMILSGICLLALRPF